MSNKYFTKGKRTQQAVRAVSRVGGKAVSALRNAGETITARVNPIKEKITNASKKPIARLKSSMANMALEREGRAFANLHMPAMKFDHAVLDVADALEQRKIISPRQAAKVRIAVGENYYRASTDSRLENTKGAKKYRQLWLDRMKSPKKTRPYTKFHPIQLLEDVIEDKRRAIGNPSEYSDMSRDELLNQVRALHHGKISDKEAKKIVKEMKRQAEELPPIERIGYRGYSRYRYNAPPAYPPIYQSRIKERSDTYTRRGEKVANARRELRANYYAIRDVALKTKRAVPKVALGLAAAKAIEMLMDKQNKEKP